MRDLVFSPNGVLKQLASLNPSKSAGPAGISPRCLPDISAEISSILKFIFQQGYDTGTLPNYWLTAMVPVLSTRNQARKTQLIIDPYPLGFSAVRWWSILGLATWITSLWQYLVSSTTWLPCRFILWNPASSEVSWLGQHLKSACPGWCPSVGFLEGFRQSLPY